jgi:hypothetical protein
MPEIGSEKNDTRGGPKKLGLMDSLKQAHALDHEILDSLGIKHPHVPVLSVIEMLDHLRNEHAEDSQTSD